MNKDARSYRKTLFLLDDPSQDKHRHEYLLNGLVEEGFRPVIGYFCGDARDSSMASSNIRAVSLGLSRARFKGFRPSTVSKLRRLISIEGVSVIHTQRHRATVSAAVAMSGTTARTLFYTVGSTNVLRNWNRRVALNCIVGRLSMVTCVSSAVRDYMLGNTRLLPGQKVQIIHNGIDIKKFVIDMDQKTARKWLGIPPRGFCFGIVARLKKAKCHDILLKAFSRLLHQAPDTRLVMVGDGPLEDRLRQLCRELEIADRVYFTGRIQHKDVPKALKAFNCFVHPSFREGLSASILEAMASGLPVITTEAGGMGDIFDITTERIGVRVRPLDVEALFASLATFRNMGHCVLKEMGENARRHVRKNFNREFMVQSYLDLYKKFCDTDTFTK